LAIAEVGALRASIADDPLRRPIVVDRGSSLPTANRKLLDYVNARIGQRVGNGQCASMVSQAFRDLSIRDYPAENGDDYVWGTFITEIRPGRLPKVAILPGDVLQYRDTKFEGRNKSGGTYKTSGGHHTAVVSSVSGQNLYLLQQNIGGDTRPVAEKEKVQGGLLYLPDMKQGWIKVYRPVLRSGSSLTDTTGGGTPALNFSKSATLPAKGKSGYTVNLAGRKSVQIQMNGNGKTDVDLFVFDPSNRQVASDIGLTDRATLTFTTGAAGNYRIEMRNLGKSSNTVNLSARYVVTR